MHLVILEHYKRRDIGRALQNLLDQYERGELKGIAVAAKDHRNNEEFILAGQYKEDMTHALSATRKMSRAINGM